MTTETPSTSTTRAWTRSGSMLTTDTHDGYVVVDANRCYWLLSLDPAEARTLARLLTTAADEAER